MKGKTIQMPLGSRNRKMNWFHEVCSTLWLPLQRAVYWIMYSTVFQKVREQTKNPHNIPLLFS